MGILNKLFNRRLQRTYISEVDEFLAEFNIQHPALSASQQTVIKKYERLDALRDEAIIPTDDDPTWKEF